MYGILSAIIKSVGVSESHACQKRTPPPTYTSLQKLGWCTMRVVAIFTLVVADEKVAGGVAIDRAVEKALELIAILDPEKNDDKEVA